MKLIVNYTNIKDPHTTAGFVVDVFDIKESGQTDKYILLYKRINKENKEVTSGITVEYDAKTQKFNNMSRMYGENPKFDPREMKPAVKEKFFKLLEEQGTINPIAKQTTDMEPLPVYFSEKGTLYVKKSDIEFLNWRPLSYQDEDYEYCEILGYELITIKRRFNLKTQVLPLTTKEQKKKAEQDKEAKRKNEINVSLLPQNEIYPLAVFYDVENYGDLMTYASLSQDAKDMIKEATGKGDSFLVGARKEEFTPELIMEYLRVLDKAKDKLDADLSISCDYVKRYYAGTGEEKMAAVAEVFDEYCTGFDLVGNRHLDRQ